MRKLGQIAIGFALMLGGCSYGYDVMALSGSGGVQFAIAPGSRHSPSCVRLIEVYAIDESVPVWRDSVVYDDDCANMFPVAYGAALQGRHEPEWPVIPAKPLRPGIVYEVHTTTGATGYGGGRFRIRPDGSIENVAPVTESARGG
ncbi:hypothetical protein [Sphingomonas sp. 1185]|uniref:hypothetical protein n=1 Tax=Sphingomonas sp. 1185 TaxID=3156411 RepID=UPI0033959A89